MTEKNEQLDSHRDRVLDRALAEIVGRDAPSDLTEEILERLPSNATRHKDETVAKPTTGRTISRTRYALALAASVLILAGGTYFLLPNINGARELARQRSDTNDVLQNGLAQSNGNGSTFSSISAPADEAKTGVDGRIRGQLSDPEPNSQQDFDATVELIQSTVNADTWKDSGRSGSVREFASNLSMTISQSQEVQEPKQSRSAQPVTSEAPLNRLTVVDPNSGVLRRPAVHYNEHTHGGLSERDGELRMMVTPRIVIQEGEDQLLHDSGESRAPDFTANPKPPIRFEDPSGRRGEGHGPGQGGDQYARIVENSFLTVAENPLSTFSIDVDTASYANMRQYLTQVQQLPPPDSVRIEELVNYFGYDYEAPTSEDGPPFAAHMEVTACPWQPKHRLLRVGLKGREIPNDERPPSNLVFLVDVSGSMDQPNKLPLVVTGLKTLAEHLGENDRVAIVVYASAEGLVLDSTPGSERHEILNALDQLRAGGSTNGGAGIELAYRIATDNLIQNGTNRVILCTDGDFNVGTTSNAALERMVEEEAKTGVFLTVLGFGRGNLNDQMMETISNRGNGNYHYVDGAREAQKVLVEEMGGTLVTIAKDVKIQIEFNPTAVASYRLIGYENRILAKEDFNDDTKDAGEIGAGHTVTALYELVPPGAPFPSGVDPLKYQQTPDTTDAAATGELLTLKLRYKEPNGETSKLLTFPLVDEGRSFGEASKDTKFAASVAMLGMLLRNSQHDGNSTYDAAIEIATDGVGHDDGGYRAEFVELIRQAKKLSGKQ